MRKVLSCLVLFITASGTAYPCVKLDFPTLEKMWESGRKPKLPENYETLYGQCFADRGMKGHLPEPGKRQFVTGAYQCFKKAFGKNYYADGWEFDVSSEEACRRADNPGSYAKYIYDCRNQLTSNAY